MKKICSLILAISLFACGGGGGSSSNLANTEMTVVPTTVEVGGSQFITINLSEVTDNLSIKVRYPEALRYVENSARFVSEEAEVFTNPAYDISENPTVAPTATAAPGTTPMATATPTPTPTSTATGTASQNAESNYTKRYLVFFLTRDAFAESRTGTLTFRLRAKDVLDSGRVELDVDLDDPSISNDEEFSVSNPQFESEEHIGIRVRN